MDQAAIGKFIQELRKEQNLTQRELAEKLLVSDKTVSKWERGGGMPEVSLMLPLCNALHITVNELLSAKRLTEQQYKEKAEENIMDLIKEKAEAKKKLVLELIVLFITVLAAVTIVVLAGLLELKTWQRILLVIIAIVIIFSGVTVATVLERDAGYYECKHCGEKFIPTYKAFLFGPHFGFTRKLKCPHCGKKSYCKKTLTKS